MPVCQSIGQHLLRLKWPHYCTFHFFWTTGCFSVSAAAHRTLFLCVKAGTWQNHSWESFHSSFPCASWGISLDYNSNSWSLCSVTTNSPVISDCPPIPLKESKQKKKQNAPWLRSLSGRYRFSKVSGSQWGNLQSSVRMCWKRIWNGKTILNFFAVDIFELFDMQAANQ